MHRRHPAGVAPDPSRARHGAALDRPWLGSRIDDADDLLTEMARYSSDEDSSSPNDRRLDLEVRNHLVVVTAATGDDKFICDGDARVIAFTRTAELQAPEADRARP